MDQAKLNQLSDEAVVDLVCRGNQEAYATIVKRYQQPLLRYARYLLSNPDDAMDAVQEGFIAAYKYLNSFNPSMKFSSWLYRIVHNQAMNTLRKRKNVVSTDELPNIVATKINHEEDQERRELKRQLDNHLQELPTKYRVVLTLYYIEEKSYQEISDILRMPINTIATHLSRAKSQLKKIYQMNEGAL
jgi:RNA polymerase sigma-70 factor (ECF subfamily)